MTHHAFSQANMGLYSLRAREKSMDTLLSVDEAARRLGGISKWTVHAWLSQGRLQRAKVGGRTMIRESELAKVIEDGGKSPAPRKGVHEPGKEERAEWPQQRGRAKSRRSSSGL